MDDEVYQDTNPETPVCKQPEVNLRTPGMGVLDVSCEEDSDSIIDKILLLV
jgi:hypothetical protein